MNNSIIQNRIRCQVDVFLGTIYIYKAIMKVNIYFVIRHLTWYVINKFIIPNRFRSQADGILGTIYTHTHTHIYIYIHRDNLKVNIYFVILHLTEPRDLIGQPCNSHVIQRKHVHVCSVEYKRIQTC